MQTQLYPPEFAEDSIERLVVDGSRDSRVIYLLLIGTLAAAIAALPLVRVNVTVQSQGIIRPATGKHDLKARASGVVDRLLVHDNQQVRQGEPLMVLRAGLLDEQERLLGAQAGEQQDFVHDLQVLVALRGGADPTASLRSARYRQAYAQLRNDLRENALKLDLAQREAQRARALGERGLAPATEVEQKEFAAAQLRAEAGLVRDRYLAAWQGELAQSRTALREALGQQGRLREDRTMYTVTAPVTGTVEELRPLSPGSFVAGGDQLATISPAEGMVVETYVAPRDIGLIRVGAPVRMQVDAFNYNEWGFATGRVVEVSDDFVLMGQQPMFKVRCSLDQRFLALRNGFRGTLKKGMTMRARFFVTERTLFQLLFDDVNDWLNPTQAPGPRPETPKEA